MKKCDIIIPIYNAYDCLRPCIESVIKNTDLKNNRLILIDDKSPDEKVLPLLEEYANDKNIILLKNDSNLGFVGTVNKGMKYSNDNDVLLLNSDTEVTSNWLKNIQNVAYSNKMVATVTPLSNNATLVSVPEGLQKNSLKEGFTLEEYSKLIQKTAYKDVFELPTAHGFCMFIKREALDAVGYFDEESFGKGYGEENDFSFRCLNYGYRNMLCPNAYVLHKESQSFSSKKQKLVEEHEKILQDRYPIYKSRVNYWCESFPIKKICENIFYEQELYNRKNILITIHDWSNINDNVGGTTLHVLDLINNLKDRYNFHVLAPENGIYKLRSYFKDCEREMFFEGINSSNIIPNYNNEYRKMIQDIITAFRIDTLHVHHMIGHCFDVIDVAKENNVYTMITLHDFYSLCPTINMLHMMKDFCIDLKNKDCQKCLKLKMNINNDIIDLWRKNWAEFLGNFDKVIVPSQNTKEILEKIYSRIKITPIEHGIDLKNTGYYPNLENEKEINIAFVGVMTTHKGGQILLNLIKKNNPKIKFHLFGKSEFKELEKNKNNYVYHGKYKRKDLPDLIKENNIHLVCSFSIWPETYSYTLTECICSGVPVLSFDIGAIQERIKKYNIGYTIPLTNDTDKILSSILEIINNEKEYIDKIDSIKKYKIKTAKEMSEEYIKFYDNNKLIAISDESTTILKKIISDNYNVNETISSAETFAIMNSLRWKLVSKIKVPNNLKRMIRKVVKK